VKKRQGQVGIVVLLVFLSALALLWLFRYTVRDTFVIPILYLLWLARLVFNSIHQVIFWGILFLAVAILLFYGLRRKSRSGSAVQRRMATQHRNWRVAHWAALVRRTSPESSHDIYARSEFRKLILSVWACRAHLSPQELEQEIKAGVLEPPSEIRSYFENNGGPGQPGRSTLRQALDRLRVRLGGHEPQSPLDADPHLRLLIESLENQLEAKT
jgi:hypothetical protein